MYGVNIHSFVVVEHGVGLHVVWHTPVFNRGYPGLSAAECRSSAGVRAYGIGHWCRILVLVRCYEFQI